MLLFYFFYYDFPLFTSLLWLSNFVLCSHFTDKIREELKLDQEMKDLAKLLIAEQSLLVVGRGYNYARCSKSEGSCTYAW